MVPASFRVVVSFNTEIYKEEDMVLYIRDPYVYAIMGSFIIMIMKLMFENYEKR